YRCYPGFGSCFYEWCSLANWNIGKQNGIRAGGAELFIKFVEPAGKGNIAVDEHAQGYIGKLLTNAADQLQSAIDGGAIGQRAIVGGLNGGAISNGVRERHTEFESISAGCNDRADDV